MTWFATLQGLLFATLGIALKYGSPKLIWPLAIIGIVVALLSFFGSFIARKAIVKLKKDWDDNKSGDYSGPDVIGHFLTPELFVILLPWFALPITFTLIWMYFLWLNM
jgi:hypothetical protein